METPLWYKTHIRDLSYSEFYDRNTDISFNTKETLPIFVLATIYNHSRYVNKDHVLRFFISENKITADELKYFYLISSLGGSFCKDAINNETPQLGDFNNMEISTDINFKYILEWINTILNCFFPLGPLKIDVKPYEICDVEVLQSTLKYAEEIHMSRFNILDKNIDKLYKLMQAHNYLISIKDFLNGSKYPSILKPYRNNIKFIKSIIDNYWPQLLNLLNNEKEFTTQELAYIRQANDKLYKDGDIDFYVYYVDLFVKIFGDDHIISKELLKFNEASTTRDALLIKSMLTKMNPEQRIYYFPQTIPVTYDQIHEFIEQVSKVGFEDAFIPYINISKELFIKQITGLKGKLVNNISYSTQDNIFIYPVWEFVIFKDQKDVYIFLRSEMTHLSKTKKNPFTNKDLPNYFLQNIPNITESKTYNDIWSNIIRRKVDMSDKIEHKVEKKLIE